MDVVAHNRAYWDGQVEVGGPWTRTVSGEEVERRTGVNFLCC